MLKRPTATFVINVVAFNILWAALVFGAVYGFDGLAFALTMVWLPIHLRMSADPPREMKLIGMVMLIGPLTDFLYIQLGLLDFRGLQISTELPPLWIIGLWIMFGTTLLHSMKWLQNRYAVAAVFGGFGGAMAYLAGCRLGAAVMLQPAPIVFAAIAMTWAIAMPLMVYASSFAVGAPPVDPPADPPVDPLVDSSANSAAEDPST